MMSSHSSFSNLADADRPRDEQTKRMSRLPSDGSFTNLYNQLTEANGSASHLAAVRIPSDTSFTDIYNQISDEIREQLDSPAGGSKSLADNSSIQHTPVDDFSPRLGEVIPTNTQAEDAPPQPPQHNSFIWLNTPIPAIAEHGPSDDTNHEPKKTHGQVEDGNNDVYTEDTPIDLPDRPGTAASTDTFQQAQTLFRDFDGAHYAPSIRESIMEEEGEPDDIDEDMARSPLLRVLPHQDSRLPPPDDGMVFYPAPVPRILNLPQRISQAPSASVQAQRRTQMLSDLPSEMRKSAPWLAKERRGSDAGKFDSGANIRNSKMDLAALPPQLRASMFFEHVSQRQEIEVRDGSAVATFDDMLDASANAPVSAFTDHPIVGHVGAGVYKKDAAARSSVSLQQAAQKVQDKKDKGRGKEREKSRSSFLGLRRFSMSSANALDNDGSKTTSKLRTRRSRDFSTALDDSALMRGPNGELLGAECGSGGTTPLRQSQLLDDDGEAVDGTLGNEDVSDDELDEAEEEEEEEEEEELVYQGPPTTLLAELQIRKNQQKQRNRTAFTSVTGMHSTLLELDAVAQLEKAKRKKTRVALAWEDPSLRAAENAADVADDDVPLGMLFSNQKTIKDQLREQGLADWDRPLGLLEKRQIEDNEPLSRRRNRLLGITPNASRTHLPVQSTDTEAGAESEEDVPGETLGQRLRRLKSKKGLDEAIGAGSRPTSVLFKEELLSQFGAETDQADTLANADLKEGSVKLTPVLERTNSTTPAEEETLGQRRARLQREREEQEAHRQSQLSLNLKTPQVTRRQSQMTLNADPAPTLRHRQSQMTIGPETQGSMQYTASGYFPQQTVPQQATPLRASRSMADLLAAHPVGNNETRKLSNELLVSLLPQGSLLAQNEERTQGRKQQIANQNRRSSGLMLKGERTSYIDVQETRPSAERRKSSGFTGGLYNLGTSGLLTGQEAARQSVLMDPNTMMNDFQTPLPFHNGMVGLPVPSQLGMDMNAFASMSSPNLLNPTMLQYPLQQIGMNMGFGTSMGMGRGIPAFNPTLSNQNVNLSSPNLLGGMNAVGMGAAPLPSAYQRQSTYSAALSAQMGGLQDTGIDSKTRDRVDAWRQGVTPS